MTRWLVKNLPQNVDVTLGGSIQAWVMNFARLVEPVKRRLGQRLILSTTDAGDGLAAVQIKGLEGRLYVPESTVGSLQITLPEQLDDWHWHYYEIPQTRVEPDDIVFDCGSAEGLFAFINRQRCRRVYAFEPLPAFVKGLSRTFSGDTNVEVVPCALGESPGPAYIREAGMSTCVTADTSGTPVTIESIDHYCAQRNIRISYLKADLEGFEMSLLRGAVESLRAFKPKIAITTYHRKEDPVEIAHWLKKVNPSYRLLLKGLNRIHRNPVMLHAW